MSKKDFFKFPKNVLELSIVSLLNDVAGETIRRLIPLFLSNVLGVKTSIIGIVEGVGEATPHLIEPFSGYFSDKTDKRKIFVIFGQILRSSMLFLVFATTWPAVLLIRFLDRTGKGFALGPRDSLLAHSVKSTDKGRAFGLNRAMDNLGATIGMVIIIGLIFLTGNPQFLNKQFFQLLVIVIAAPSLLIAFLLLVFAVKEKKDGEEDFVFRDHLGKGFYTFLGFSFIFYLGSFSDGFLLLKAQNIGVPLVNIFVLLAIYTFSSTLVALPAGSYSDHHERRRVLVFGWLAYAVANIGLGIATSFWQLIPLFIIHGLYYGATQGVAKAIIVDLVPHSREGLAFGLYSMVTGLALLPASIIAGYLWQATSPMAAFYFGAVLALIAALGLFHILPQPQKHRWNNRDKYIKSL